MTPLSLFLDSPHDSTHSLRRSKMTKLSFARSARIELALKTLSEMNNRSRCAKARWYQRPACFIVVMVLALFSRWQKGFVPLVPLIRNSDGYMAEHTGTVSPSLRTNLQAVLQMHRIPFSTDAEGTIFVRRWCSWDKATIAYCTAEALRLTEIELPPKETMLLHAHRR